MLLFSADGSTHYKLDLTMRGLYRFIFFLGILFFSSASIANDKHTNFTPIAPPSATIDRVEGTMKAFFDLEVFYTYTPNPNAEGATQIQWYTYDDVFSPGTKTPIPGATNNVFSITNAMVGLHISVEVTPVDNMGVPGTTVEYFPSWSLAGMQNPVLPDNHSCNRAGLPGAPDTSNNLTGAPSLCSPRSVLWNITYTGINIRFNQLPRIAVEWGDGTTDFFLPTLVNPEETNLGLQVWEVDAVHIFDYDDPLNTPAADGSCTYEMVTYYTLVNFADITVRICRNADQILNYTVWDDLDNADLGTKNIDHDPTSTGGEVGETVEVCEGDTNVIRLTDVSDFNCTPPMETLTPNQDSRWYQWVYGSTHNISTGAASDEKIIINGVSYDATDFPLYGEPQLQTGPVGAPNGITDDIQMPIIAQDGEVFEVTLRSWNTCNKFSRSGDNLMGPQIAPFDVFDIYGGPGTIQNGAASPLFANANPVLTTFDIVIVAKPLDPVPTNRDICNGAALPNFDISFTAASSSISWFEDNAGVPGTPIPTSNNNSKTLPVADYQPVLSIDNTVAGVYSVWASYVANTGSQDCESDPIRVDLSIREDLPEIDASDISSSESFPICADAANFTFSVPDETPQTNSPGGAWEYQWVFGNGTNDDNLAFVGPTNGRTVTVDITSNTASGARQIRVRKRYVNADDNGSDCEPLYRNFDFNIDAVSDGGIVSVVGDICNGDPTGDIELTAQTGTTIRWQRSVDGGIFSNLPVSFNDLTTISQPAIDIPAGGTVPVTYTYRAQVTNGVCAFDLSDPATITVNPIPSKPTIAADPSATICEDGSTELEATSNAAADSYQWYESGVPVVGEISSTITLSTVGESGSYTVRAFGANPTSCESELSDPIIVTINSLPEAADPTGGGSICAGNAAPDIVWSLTGSPPFQVTYTDGITTFGPFVEATNTYTLTAPVTLNAGTYQITALADDNGCPAASLGGDVDITIGGAPPVVDVGPSLDITAACDDGGSTINPELAISLDDANSASQVGFILTYTIDGSANRTITFDTDAVGDPTTSIIFGDAELNNLVPTPHVINLVSIQSPTACLTTLNIPLNFTVNPRPSAPANPIDAISCSTGTINPVSVDDPSAGSTILWYTAFTDLATNTPVIAADGVVSGNNGEVFTPASSATATFYATTQDDVTFCISSTAVQVEHTQDLLPTAADADADDDDEFLETCSAQLTLGAVAADNGGTGTWSTLVVGVTFDDVNVPTTTVNNLPIGTTTLTWTVTSNLGECGPTSEDIDVERLPLPVVNNITPELCEQLPRNSNLVEDVDLTDAIYTDAITGIVGSTDRTFEYFSDPLYSVTIADETAEDIINNEVIYVRVTDIGTSGYASNFCTSDATIIFTVNKLPEAIDQNSVNNYTETVFCEESVSSVNTKDDIDLTTLNDNVTNSAADRSVEWFADPGGVVTVRGDLTGFEIPTETDVDNVASGDIFYAIVVDDLTLCEDIAEVEITVNPRPADNPIIAPDGSMPASLSVCSSTNVLFFQVNNLQTPGSTYDWTIPTGVGELELVGGGGPNDFFVLVRAPNVNAGLTLSVQEISAVPASCEGNVNEIEIIVEDAPSQPVILGTASVCTNQQNVVYSIQSPVGGSTYTWNIRSLGSIVSGQGTSSIIVNIGTSSDDITVSETNATGCTSPVADPFPVSVNPRPTMTSDPVLEICSGETINDGSATPNFTFTSSIAGSTFNWVVLSKTGSVGGATVGDAAAGNIPHTLTNTSGAPGSVTYEVTPTSPAPASCVGPTQVLTVSVNSEPVGLLHELNICSDTPINYDIQTSNIDALGNNLPSVFSYTVSSEFPGVISVAGLDRGVASNASITDTFTNTSGADVDITYSITPIETSSGTNCPGQPFDVIFTIQSESVGQNDTDVTCSNDALAYDLQTNVDVLAGFSVPTTFSWSAVNNPIITGESLAPQIGDVIDDVLINQSGLDEMVIYTVIPTNTASGCPGDPFTITVTVFSEPVGVNDNIQTCSNDLLSYDLQLDNINASGNNVVSDFIWRAAANPNVSGESTTDQSTIVNGDNLIDDNLVNLTGVNQTVVYTVTPTDNTNACVGGSFIINVTVFPEPEGTDDAISTCSDDALAYNLQANVNNVNIIPSNFNWIAADNINVIGEELVGEISGTIDDVLINDSGVDQDVIYTVTPTDISHTCDGQTFEVRVTVFSKPKGYDQSIDVCSNQPIGYDFQANVDNLVGGGNGQDATFTWIATANGSVTGESTTVQSGSTITDIITNTTNADVDVIYTVTPTSDDANTCEGEPFIITVTVQGDPLGGNDVAEQCSDVAIGYNLQDNIDNLGNGAASTFSWVAIDNPNVENESTVAQTGNFITDVVENVSGNPEVVNYTVTPTSIGNSCVGLPFIVSITINSEPVGILDDATICSDESANYNLQNNVTTLGNDVTSTFEWIAIANASVSGENSTTSTSNNIITDDLTNITGVDQTVRYSVIPTSAGKLCEGEEFFVDIIVRSEPVGTADAVTTCSDVALTYDLAANVFAGNGMTASYTWVATANGAITGENTTNQTGNIINDVLSNTSGVNQDVVYTVTPRDINFNCIGDPFLITVTVFAEPEGSPETITACSSDNLNYDLQANVDANNVVSSTFVWVAADNVNVTGESTTPQTGSIITDAVLNFTGSDQNVLYTVTPTTDNADACVGNPFVITATIKSQPRGVDDIINTCSDEALNYSLQANVNSPAGNSMASTFTWVANADVVGVTGESLTDQATSIINDDLVNVTSGNLDVVYTVTPTANGCEGNSFEIRVTVNPEPQGNDDTKLICSRQNVAYDLQNNVNSAPDGNSRPANYTWSASVNANVTGASTTPKNTPIIDDVLVNISGMPQDITYTIIPTGINGCIGKSFELVVTVNSESVGFADTDTECSDVMLNYDLQANVDNTGAGGNSVTSTFSWVAASNTFVTGESTIPQTGAFINDVITNTTSSDQTVSYTVTPTSSDGCIGSDFIVNITIQKGPRGDDEDLEICSQGTLSYDLQNNINTIGNGVLSTFTWVATANADVSGESTTDQTTGVINDQLINVSGVDQTVIYTVSPVSNPQGCDGTDFEIRVTVKREPVGSNTTEGIVCSGDAFSFDPQVNILNTVSSSFTWSANYNGLTGGAGTGNGDVAEILINQTNGVLNAVYTVIPSNGLCAGSPFTITVPVNPEPVGTSETKSPNICSDQSFDFNPQDNVDDNNGLASTFTWTAVYEPGLTVKTPGTNTGNINEQLENLTNGVLNATYTVVPTDIATLCEGNSFTITVRINPEPVGNALTLNAECSDRLFNYNPQTNINGNNSLTSSFTWTATYDPGLMNGVGTGTGVISESLTNQTDNILNAIYTIIPTDLNTLCVGDAFVITQPIYPEPLGISSTVAAVCSDTQFDIDPQANVDDIVNGGNGITSNFIWSANYPAGINGGVGSGTGNIIETLVNNSGGSLSVVYTVVPTGDAPVCAGDAFTITVPITSAPAGYNEVKPIVCSNTPFDFDPQTNIDAVNSLPSTFTWSVTHPAGIDVITAGTGVGNIAETLQNLTGSRINVVYEVIPTSGGCVGEMFSITVPIDPEPVGATTTLAPICAKDEIDITPQDYITNGIVSSFTWSAVYPAGITSGAGSGIGTIRETLINDTGGQLTVPYSIIPTGISSSCIGAAFIINVPVDPSPVAIDQTPIVCSDVPVTQVSTVDLTALENAITGGSGSTVTWFLDEFLNAPVANPASHTVFDAIPVYAQVDNGTCTNVAIVTYTIEPLPQVSGIVTSDYNGRDVSCEGATDGIITAEATGTPGPFTYELLDADGNPLGVTNNDGIFSGLGAGVYTIRAVDNSTANACSGVSFPVILSDPFPFSGGFVFGPQNICDGEVPAPFIELAAPFGGIGNYSYQWEISTDNVSYTPIVGANDATYLSDPLTNGTVDPVIYYFRRLVSSGTCTPVYSNNADPIEVTVNPTPDGDFNFMDTDGNIITEICEGAPFIIEFTFSPGTPPLRFDYDDGTTFNTDVFGVNPTPIIDLDGITEDLTINLTRVNDVFGCENTLSVTKTLSVLKINPNFSISPAAVCSDETVTFDFNVDADVQYVFNYGDGSPNETIPANTLAVGPSSVSHVYQNGNFNADVSYPVTLIATKTEGTVCNATPIMQSVTVFANVFPNIIPEKVSICGGESILFDNQSLGVINQKWFYREQGVNEERDVRTTSGDQIFTFNNNSQVDPVVYEIVYQGDNGKCAKEQIVTVEVYKNLTSSFDVTSVSEFVAGKGTVTLNNTSTPTPPDDAFFTYEWFFGLDATPQTSTGYSPPSVIEYSEPGTKQLSLVVTNIAAAANGVSCSESYTETVDIVLPPITAEFTLDPPDGCSRLEVNITTNTSKGANKFDWSVLGLNDVIVAQSTEILPTFILETPGEYRIFLKASYPATGQEVTSQPQLVQVYENPVARFDVLQTIVYLPDDGFRPINRSQGANSFTWDFGDGNTATTASPEHFYDLPNTDPGYLVTLTAINENQCIDIDTARVKVDEGGFTKTPNAFTPNLDGPSSGIGGGNGGAGSQLNDIFLPITEGVEQFHMWIFDRWGNLVFESDDKTRGWDGYNFNGKLLPSGVYVYKLELELSNGQRSTRVGDVTLLR